MKDLTKGKPLKIILLFGIPILIGNIFNLFYNLADTRIVGTYLGQEALAAIGSISTLGDFMTGIVIGFANGFGVLTAQLYGMGKKDTIRKSFYVSLEMGTGITAFLVLITHIFMKDLLKILNITGSSAVLSSQYILIIINGLIFSMVYNVLAANLRAIGDAYTPLIFLIVSALLNVFLDILFVGYTGLGVRGAALATILSQAISAFACLIYMLSKYPMLRAKMNDFRPTLSLIRDLFINGSSMAMMSCLVQFGTLALQTTINTFGEETIVAHTAARKITTFYMLPNYVFGTCMATYCGQNYGAQRMDRIRAGVKDTLLIAYCWAFLVMLMSYTIAPYLIIGVTDTSSSEVITTACNYLRTDSLFYLVCHTISIVRSSLQGMDDHITPVISSGLELIGKVLIAYLLAPRIGYWGIIWAEPIIWCVMVIPLIISMVRILFWNTRKGNEAERRR